MFAPNIIIRKVLQELLQKSVWILAVSIFFVIINSNISVCLSMFNNQYIKNNKSSNSTMFIKIKYLNVLKKFVYLDTNEEFILRDKMYNVLSCNKYILRSETQKRGKQNFLIKKYLISFICNRRIEVHYSKDLSYSFLHTTFYYLIINICFLASTSLP